MVQTALIARHAPNLFDFACLIAQSVAFAQRRTSGISLQALGKPVLRCANAHSANGVLEYDDSMPFDIVSVPDPAAHLTALGGLVNGLPVGIVFYDMAQVCRFANPAALELFAIAREDALGNTLEKLIGASDYAAVASHFDRAFGGKIAFYERQVLRPERAAKWFDFALIPDFDSAKPAPAARGVYAFITDVTARHVQARAIAEQKRHMQLALSAARMATWNWDVRTGHLHFDEGAKNLVDAAKFGQVRNAQDLIDMVHPDDLAPMRALLARALKGEALYELEHRIRGIDGNWFWMQSRGQVVEVEMLAGPSENASRQRALRMMGVSFDISERKRAQAEHQRAEAAVAESEARFRALTALSSDWYWEIDAQYRFTRYESSKPEETLPMHVDQIIGMQRWNLGGTVLYPESWAVHRAQLERREAFRDLLIRDRNMIGDVVYLSLSGEPIFDTDHNFMGYRGVGRNVTERFRSEEKIAYLAYHDVLTDLPNRTLVQDRVVQAVAHAQRTGQTLAVLFIDLDNFKSINDSMGHAAGDEVLVEAARRLRRELRAEDTMGRFGGDEFIALLPSLQVASDAGAVADKLISGLCLPMQIGQQELSLTCSIGIALFPDDGVDEGTLTRNADAAMYHAKETGRNTFRYFTSSLNAHATRRLSLENDLKRGIERGEFTLMYQPQVAVASGKVAGVEALVRWNRSGYGDVTPAEFIPLCENIGVIATLGRWVLEQALSQMRRWIDAEVAPPRIAVNVSAKQLYDPGFSQQVANAMVDAGVEAARLELEITESAALEHRSEIVLTIDQLRRLGVRFCLDDFGTGYSSLAYLKRFPVDVIKIDRSFVSEVHKNNGGAAVVKAVLALARGLDIDVVAEGVELAEQAAILRALDCPVAQGFYHAKPLSATACADFMRERGVAL